jgi:hypothetical protein
LGKDATCDGRSLAHWNKPPSISEALAYQLAEGYNPPRCEWIGLARTMSFGEASAEAKLKAGAAGSTHDSCTNFK